jgi:hypothetical protein
MKKAHSIKIRHTMKLNDEIPTIDIYSLNGKTPEIDKFKQKPAYSSFYSIFLLEK